MSKKVEQVGIKQEDLRELAGSIPLS